MPSYRREIAQVDKQRYHVDRDMQDNVRRTKDNFDWDVFEAALLDKALVTKKIDREDVLFLKRVNGYYVDLGISGMVNFKIAEGMSVFIMACYRGYTNIVKKLLRFEELDVNYNEVLAAFIAVQANSKECFIELTKCDRVDWNFLDYESERIVLNAAYFHRVEMLQALSTVKGVNWNHQNKSEGLGVGHYAIVTLSDSCYQILAILLEIPNFNINQRNHVEDTPLCLALKKRDFKAIVMLFQFPNLELKQKDFDKALQKHEDIDTMISECFKSYRDTGYNYSDVVDFLTEYKKSVIVKNPKKTDRGRKGRNRGF